MNLYKWIRLSMHASIHPSIHSFMHIPIHPSILSPYSSAPHFLLLLFTKLQGRYLMNDLEDKEEGGERSFVSHTTEFVLQLLVEVTKIILSVHVWYLKSMSLSLLDAFIFIKTRNTVLKIRKCVAEYYGMVWRGEYISPPSPSPPLSRSSFSKV